MREDARILCIQCGRRVPDMGDPCWTRHQCTPESPIYVWNVWRILAPEQLAGPLQESEAPRPCWEHTGARLHFEGTIKTHEATIQAAQTEARRRWGKGKYAAEINPGATQAESEQLAAGEALQEQTKRSALEAVLLTVSILILFGLLWANLATPHQQSAPITTDSALDAPPAP